MYVRNPPNNVSNKLMQNFSARDLSDNKIRSLFCLSYGGQNDFIQPAYICIDKAGFERKFLCQPQQFAFVEI